MKAAFILREIKLKDRDLDENHGIKEEELIIELKFVSKGNASEITDDEIMKRVFEYFRKPIL